MVNDRGTCRHAPAVHSPLWAAVARIALTLERRSAYDAAYLALAQDLDAELWTLDGALARNATSHGYPIHLIQ
jgi:predicted nucleic acid-binding protein